jgi:hypothetical protein
VNGTLRVGAEQRRSLDETGMRPAQPFGANLFGSMTTHAISADDALDRAFDMTAGDDHGASRREAAALWRGQGIGQVPFEARNFRAAVGVRQRNGRQQSARIGMARPVEYSVGIGAFHDLAKIHHRDASADISHDVQVVGDKDVGQAEAVTQLDEKVEDSGSKRASSLLERSWRPPRPEIR